MKQSWKWNVGPWKTMFLQKGGLVSFHVCWRGYISMHGNVWHIIPTLTPFFNHPNGNDDVILYDCIVPKQKTQLSNSRSREINIDHSDIVC